MKSPLLAADMIFNEEEVLWTTALQPLNEHDFEYTQ